MLMKVSDYDSQSQRVTPYISATLCLQESTSPYGVSSDPMFLRIFSNFSPLKFAACSKPPSRDNHRKASYPRTQERDQGAN